ncbi:hypothetical protein SARC_03531 [Sphaeroforma arctica JP610]|uniref:Uncharacterized protein n=1 Tax=Sphaeroforma arctica JP610 TaxID=667725 RepID=A0A0L0G5C3_9EUKA|nr:hypothetical protein SARC_03531 [Sphaeroforma arctica JP610]KNC84230.1 hypothetical protein SARC_03531 [Sphaeroforma arctica JP610]|eukprot:XP_014158132.1 hypothetical protein SARC_03531 [Sphaeroforma arctica JP610]
MTKAIGTRWTHSLSRQAKNIATAIFVLFTVNLVYGNYSTYGVGVRSSSLLELSRRTGLPVSGDTYDDRSASQDDVLFSFAGHSSYLPAQLLQKHASEFNTSE